MKAGRDYKATLIERLKDPKEAESYLNAALEDGNPKVFLIALRDGAAAYGNMSSFAKQCKIHRASLYRITSCLGNPRIENVMKLIDCIGLHFRIERKPQSKAAHT